MTDPLDEMPRVVEDDMAEQVRGDRRGELSVFSCPECGGSLWQVNDHDLVRFRCHVGHAYYGEALLREQVEALEAALWTAVRTFKERAILSRQIAAGERAQGRAESAQRFDEQAEQAARYGALIQEHVLGRPVTPPGPAAG
jgi:two-component system chemotaxis response regulator CheB